MTAPYFLTATQLRIIDDRRDLPAAEDALRRAQGKASQLTGFCACGQETTFSFLSECLSCQLDRVWRNSSAFAIEVYTEPVPALHAFLWHHMGLDDMALRYAFAAFAWGRRVETFEGMTEAERDEIYDLINGWQHPGGQA